MSDLTVKIRTEDIKLLMWIAFFLGHNDKVTELMTRIIKQHEDKGEYKNLEDGG